MELTRGWGVATKGQQPAPNNPFSQFNENYTSSKPSLNLLGQSSPFEWTFSPGNILLRAKNPTSRPNNNTTTSSSRGEAWLHTHYSKRQKTERNYILQDGASSQLHLETKRRSHQKRRRNRTGRKESNSDNLNYIWISVDIYANKKFHSFRDKQINRAFFMNFDKSQFILHLHSKVSHPHTQKTHLNEFCVLKEHR